MTPTSTWQLTRAHVHVATHARPSTWQLTHAHVHVATHARPSTWQTITYVLNAACAFYSLRISAKKQQALTYLSP